MDGRHAVPPRPRPSSGRTREADGHGRDGDGTGSGSASEHGGHETDGPPTTNAPGDHHANKMTLPCDGGADVGGVQAEGREQSTGEREQSTDGRDQSTDGVGVRKRDGLDPTDGFDHGSTDDAGCDSVSEGRSAGG